MKYRKKPVVIEAEKYEAAGPTLPSGVFITAVDPSDPMKGNRAVIETLEGTMTVNDGDFVITGVKGERYPCKPDIFAATYEAVEEHETVATPNDKLTRDAGAQDL